MHQVYRVHKSRLEIFKFEAARKHPSLSFHQVSSGSLFDFNEYINSEVYVFAVVSDDETLKAFVADLEANKSCKGTYKEISAGEYFL
ncbi:hypothetical protein [Erwinia rhapontici]|uniref:hypothetical protein n=1 Tax=Erwinia rhapontici TaxID=55212 RepID=UPI00133175A5|nr:hypothetical protein [Erwinia rhapontici]MBP2156880.1 hypothetical protein [Erwinia rhapontici]